MELETILLTGGGGFVGRHFAPALRAAFPAARIIATSQDADADENFDITDRGRARELISRLRPDICVHLAGVSAIGHARADPGRAWAVNLQGTLNIAEAILAAAPDCRLIFISSGEVYGGSFRPGLPLAETAVLAPLNLYAATKAAAELALGAMTGDGLHLLRLRPFNHTGPGQSEDFVVPAFAGQIARIEAGLAAPEISVGALDPERDFLDIRDVCGAYIASIRTIGALANNQIINIASGRAVKIGTLLERLLARAKCRISVRRDPARLRPVEISRAIGDAGLAAEILDWRPQFGLEETLDTVLNFARAQHAARSKA
jgi:GDP-4-dehydro-6-deoxy-D-mannose reductase